MAWAPALPALSTRKRAVCEPMDQDQRHSAAHSATVPRATGGAHPPARPVCVIIPPRRRPPWTHVCPPPHGRGRGRPSRRPRPPGRRSPPRHALPSRGRRRHPPRPLLTLQRVPAVPTTRLCRFVAAHRRAATPVGSPLWDLGRGSPNPPARTSCRPRAVDTQFEPTRNTVSKG